MRKTVFTIVMMIAILAALALPAFAGPTALCNDDTYSYAAHHQGACSHHGGVSCFYDSPGTTAPLCAAGTVVKPAKLAKTGRGNAIFTENAAMVGFAAFGLGAFTFFGLRRKERGES